MGDETEIAWHRKQIVKIRLILAGLEAGNIAGS